MYSLLLILWLTISNCGFSSTEFNSLNGRHLHVIWTKWSGNPKGLWGPLKGGVALDFLSARLNFTYEMIQVTENNFVPQGNEKGLFRYLWDQECDLLVHDVPSLFYRSRIDMTIPWIFTNYALLIPVAGDTANINAAIKPFQWPVWWGLGISIVCVMAVLTSLLLFFPHHLPASLDSNRQVETTRNNLGSLPVIKELLGKQYLYVIGVILSQGGLCMSKRLSIRLVAGVWCLAAFIFVQAYSSILFTYVVTPVNLPLVNSVHDIVERNDIRLFLNKGMALDVFTSEPNGTGIFFKLGNKLKSFPNSGRCVLSECASQITPGSRNVFAHAVNYLKDVIKEDFEKSGKCNLQIAKEGFMPIRVSFALQHNSPYTKSINKGKLG
ncbi:ionotropic receptor 93a-like isoform X2 [Daphnia pulex]|uniref:ionotropic receptor 93a-like isoform X2 n=1 Tax=Daphnia pulex TaxID=6669 RepID=UPI001EDF6BE1|nr:ionotropic receptor 93a-like isoform X2 [Daphnia pulex]